MVNDMISMRQKLLDLAVEFSRLADAPMTLSTVSTRVFNDGKALARIANGGDLTTGSFERALRWFSAHWPPDVPWPEGIPRPPADPPEAAA